MWKDILKDLSSQNNKQFIDFVHKVVIPKVREVHPNEVMVRFDKSNDSRPNVAVAPLGTPQDFINEINKHTTGYETRQTSKDTVWIKADSESAYYLENR
tara:strand:- start:1064 stop:1360 length:297 start_codon:yes stop_codon:yes gene_type:complete